MLPSFSDSKFISFTIVKIQMAIRFKIDLKNTPSNEKKNTPSTYLPTYLLLYISIFMTMQNGSNHVKYFYKLCYNFPGR